MYIQTLIDITFYLPITTPWTTATRKDYIIKKYISKIRISYKIFFILLNGTFLMYNFVACSLIKTKVILSILLLSTHFTVLPKEIIVKDEI